MGSLVCKFEQLEPKAFVENIHVHACSNLTCFSFAHTCAESYLLSKIFERNVGNLSENTSYLPLGIPNVFQLQQSLGRHSRNFLQLSLAVEGRDKI